MPNINIFHCLSSLFCDNTMNLFFSIIPSMIRDLLGNVQCTYDRCDKWPILLGCKRGLYNLYERIVLWLLWVDGYGRGVIKYIIKLFILYWIRSSPDRNDYLIYNAPRMIPYSLIKDSGLVTLLISIKINDSL